MLKRPAYLLTILFLFCGILSAEAQYTIPPKPTASGQTSVYDYSKLLRFADKEALEDKLISYADTTGTQIVVIIIETSMGEDLALLGAKWGQEWGIGQEESDNGILILLAEKDRRVDISTGYGIEYRITDRMAKRVIEDYMIPHFKDNKYYNGLDAGTDVLIQMLEGEFKTEKPKTDFPWENVIMWGIFLLILILILVRPGSGGSGGSRKGGKHHGPSVWDMIILSNAGRTGGNWGGSSGGSFGGGFSGGFGGGGFGGGGASGSW